MLPDCGEDSIIEMKNSEKEIFSSFCVFIVFHFQVSIFVIVLVGFFPIGWILAPTSSYYPASGGTGEETVLHVVKNVVAPNSATEKPVLMSVDIYSDAAIGVYLWEHIFKGRSPVAKLCRPRNNLK